MPKHWKTMCMQVLCCKTNFDVVMLHWIHVPKMPFFNTEFSDVLTFLPWSPQGVSSIRSSSILHYGYRLRTPCSIFSWAHQLQVRSCHPLPPVAVPFSTVNWHCGRLVTRLWGLPLPPSPCSDFFLYNTVNDHLKGWLFLISSCGRGLVDLKWALVRFTLARSDPLFSLFCP